MSIVVFVEEEYGYREWLWYPDMSKEDLKEWWLKLETVNSFFFCGAASMPGKAVQIIFDDIIDGKAVYKYEDGTNVIFPENHWKAHLHEDDDSWLKPYGEKFILHAGYREEEY